jgi:hypothetical protein
VDGATGETKSTLNPIVFDKTDEIQSLHYEEATGKLITVRSGPDPATGFNIIHVERRWQGNVVTEKETVAIIND